MREEHIIEAARVLRAAPDRPQGPDPAELDALLRRADTGEPVADEILTLLAADPATREELSRLLPQEPDTSRAVDAPPYSGLPGHGEPSEEIIYRCPRCGYEYPVFEVGEPVPEHCPRGHGPLARVV
ncbi:hypothetical protein ACF1B0_35410 [Streptomyces anandii]|uniref:hypothetical protein n=1 Tax=Streptomyces anandii TaxID=285454 RepID=UPI0036F7F012